MRRPLFISLIGLILISLLEWGVNNQIEHYQPYQDTNQYQGPLFGGAVSLGLRDGIAWFWQWVNDNDKALLVIFTFLLFVVTAYLVKYTRGLLIEARNQFPHFKANVQAALDSANAAKESAEAAKSQAIATDQELRRSHRAWVGPFGVPEIIKKLTFENSVARLTIKVSLKNVGNSPANGTFLSSNIYISPTTTDPRTLIPPIDMVRAAKQSEDMGVLILPGDIVDVNPECTSYIGRMSAIRIWWIGHMGYRDEFQDLHITSFCYSFVTEDRERDIKPIGSIDGRLERFGVGWKAT